MIGGLLDLTLGIVKVLVGFVSNSQALIADGIHSFSDLLSDIFVIFAARHASQAPDKDHPYGHGRIQTAASILLAISLMLVAVGIIWDSTTYLDTTSIRVTNAPFVIIIAAGSAVFKEGIYQFTIRSARKTNSRLLEANAWHSRSDAFSSLVVIVATIGVLVGFPWADPVAAIIVAGLIAKVAWKIGYEGFSELIDTGVPITIVKKIEEVISKVEGVDQMHQLRTRKMGKDVFADVHIRVAKTISVSEGHRIGDEVTVQLRNNFASIKDVVVHIDPEDDDETQPSINLPLRSAITKSIDEAFTNLLRSGVISQSRLPVNVILHYLEGTLSIEISLPLDGHNRNELDEIIRPAISAAIEKSIGPAKITFLLVP